jgi:hypothetical protein
MFADQTDLLDALFGSDVFVIDAATGDARSARTPNGLVIGRSGPQYRRLSAVLVTTDLAPWATPRIRLACWKSPRARFPLDCDGGGVVSMVDPQGDGSLAVTPATSTVGDLLGLPADWPGPEEPFPRA